MTKDGEPICLADLVRRANIRKLRLHACACLRLTAPRKVPKWVFELIKVAERYADGELGPTELLAASERRLVYRHPRKWRGDYGWAFIADDVLQHVWAGSIKENRIFHPTDSNIALRSPDTGSLRNSSAQVRYRRSLPPGARTPH